MATHPSILALPEKFHGQRNLVCYSPWGNRESDMTEQLNTQQKIPWPHWRLLVWTGPGHTGTYQGSIHTDQQDEAVCVLHPCQLDNILFSLNFTLWSDQIRSDQSLSRVRLFVNPWIEAHQASLSITNSRSSLRLKSIESVMPSSHLILCDGWTF